jgi:Leucine-rich repeat (LRR) protein
MTLTTDQPPLCESETIRRLTDHCEQVHPDVVAHFCAFNGIKAPDCSVNVGRLSITGLTFAGFDYGPANFTTLAHDLSVDRGTPTFPLAVDTAGNAFVVTTGGTVMLMTPAQGRSRGLTVFPSIQAFMDALEHCPAPRPKVDLERMPLSALLALFETAVHTDQQAAQLVYEVCAAGRKDALQPVLTKHPEYAHAAIMGAVYGERIDVVNALLDAGVPVDLERGGKWPLCFAAYSDNVRMVETLLARGADPTKKYYGEYLYYPGSCALVRERIKRAALERLAATVFAGGRQRLGEHTLRVQHVESLDGIEVFQELELLELKESTVCDLRPLETLSHLHSLYANGANIEDLGPLSEHFEMLHLHLIDNPISDLSPLRQMKSLTQLHLVGTNVTDLSPLRDLENLEVLTLDSRGVCDISVLSRCTKLRELSLVNASIVDLSPLAELRNLEVLWLDKVKVSDLSPLSGLTRLRVLSLQLTRVTDVSPLSGLCRLEELVLSAARVSDLRPLSGLTSLKKLTAPNCRLADLRGLEGMKNLSELDIRSAKLTDLSPLAGSSIGQLNISDSTVRNLLPLVDCPNLYRVAAHRTQITPEHVVVFEQNRVAGSAAVRVYGAKPSYAAKRNVAVPDQSAVSGELHPEWDDKPYGADSDNRAALLVVGMLFVVAVLTVPVLMCAM